MESNGHHFLLSLGHIAVLRTYAALLQTYYSVVCLSVGLSVTIVSPAAKTAEPIEMPFGKWTRVGPRKHIFDEVTLAPPGEYD